MGTTLPGLIHPDDRDLDLEDRARLLAGEIPSYQVEKRSLRAEGAEEAWIHLSVSLVRSDAGAPLYTIAQVQDVTERRVADARLDFLLDHDFLTGLYNRRRFERDLHEAVARSARYRRAGAVVLIDLDHFKAVNDTFDHRAGDDLLKSLAEVFRQRVRSTDVLARLSGDEFAVLLPETNADEALGLAEALVKSVRRHPAAIGSETITLTASAGVAVFDHLTDAEVLSQADHAMYQAKEAGRDRVVLARARGRRGGVTGRLREAERLRRAIAGGRMVLYCQSILDLAGGEVSQYELLVRLLDERSAEPLPPSTFLYVAERFELIQALDAWVSEQAIALIARHQREGRRLVLEVNLSGRSIGDLSLAARIEELVAASGIDPSQLILELTETAAIANMDKANRFAQRLSRIGCRFALDDFGAGFGSFYYLKHLPFDFIKIDGDFIRELTASPTDQLVVQAIVAISRGMGRRTVAEFVGDEATLRMLRDLGVDYAQGFHVGRPRPVGEILPIARSAGEGGRD